MALRVITAPTERVISLDEARAQLGLLEAERDWDEQIDAWITAAQRHVENKHQRRYTAQVLEWIQDSWSECMVLPLAPGGDVSKVTVTSVKYADLQGAQQTLDSGAMYWSRPAGHTLAVVRRRLAVWPPLGDAAERVVIRFAITSTAADAPPGVKAAVKLLVSHWFRNREAVVGIDSRDTPALLPLGVDDLVADEEWTA